MKEALKAHTFNEARYYLMVTACKSCGTGLWEINRTEPASEHPRNIDVHAQCKNCGAKKKFHFACENDVPSTCPEAECINPTDRPSRIIDLGQWLSLFYLLVESAASESASPTIRRYGYQAALCLTEALKFYGDDNQPPEAAFFTDATAENYRKHPENYVRQRLLDIQAKLPNPTDMARRLARDERAGKRRWWKFWRR